MSRTYRRKDGKSSKGWMTSKDHVFLKYVSLDEALSQDYESVELGGYFSCYVRLKPDSKEYRYEEAKYHSDAGTHNFKEPGPGWFRNIYATRPNRRETKNELRKVILDPEYDPVITENNRKILPYWT